ncbi:MAG TPA: DUF2264 domain-containing protein [Acidobacteriaceae bacterium]
MQGASALLLPRELSALKQQPSALQDLATRSGWLFLLGKIITPVLEAAASGHLEIRMPVEAASGLEADLRRCTHLEAIGRTLAGIATWLENGATTGPEGQLRARFAALAQQSLVHGVDPKSPAWLRFGEERQTIVDAGFLALALARAPKMLRESLPAHTQTQLADALRATRRQSPPENSWLLFAAPIEAALFQLGEDWDRARVDDALRKHAAWYLRDGVYGDGPHYHANYYDSYVIHPVLLSVLDVLAQQDPSWPP